MNYILPNVAYLNHGVIVAMGDPLSAKAVAQARAVALKRMKVHALTLARPVRTPRL